jgi:hypothetical protein
MRKSAFFICASVLIFLVMMVFAHSQDDMVIISTDAFKDPQRPPAVFQHDAHNESAQIEECNVCHHVYENGELVEDESSEDQRCSDCHELTASGETPALRKAFHANCKGCHQKNKNGPIMCGQCHVRRSGNSE